ncbi:carbohydrate ABC transporter permease [Streptomyces sp. NPDC059688]|uniref:Sugar ABC transporter permease n=1 Tax=Streptomyces sp. 900105245 TaxID=3154379 RepID=A0ABV1UA92_9ACTN|nr:MULTISPECIES: sugar ABC transporter permease [unclassified Streptomyces]PKW10148.1 carbohydrate ABC transporter membrane protein 1 (CUT1 family) [Streptomyces sp. 5112.2]ROP50903.1 carbohydrate ABC transporter membrane protein 1 (CUT1 family) [Streptomyces sp. PanSC9]SEC14206.1 carbohydrate ABC transporter membrane protein 1, CUT1 family [Streptomyces sp. 1222.5]SED78530.1 carbohydrate ABC transporter membrane protein 1, CUT1 family [Streptomyces sp. 2231.1]
MTARRRAARALPLTPALVLLLLFLAGPIAYCAYIAFTDLQLTGQAHSSFVGLANFRRAFRDDAFLNAVWLTLVFTVLSSLVGQNTLGLALAALMKRASKPVRTLTGGVVVTAWVLPEVVAGFLLYAFFRREGTLNAILDQLHLPRQNWLFTLPVLAVSFANVWRGTAFSMLVYSAALDGIPAEITEAAEVDGAGGWRRMWHITLPMIRRSIGTNLMLNTLQTLSVFGLIWVMTRGGPGDRSQTLPLYMYEQAFQNSMIGYGTAVALLLLLVGSLFSVVYLRLLRTEV